MKILITGAAGDIGSRLVDFFQNDTEVELYTTALEDLLPSVNSQHKAFDIRDAAFIQWVKDIKPDVIVHLASMIQLPESMSRQEAFDIDVKATQSLLDVAVEVGVKSLW
ncbi:MAG: UDP-glucose 4-epimerase [Oceanicoccus sp.]|jgi:UDP-glucose 4-epimerase